jgi:hypothetical protein
MTDFFEDLTDEEVTGEILDEPPAGGAGNSQEEPEYDQPEASFVGTNYRGPVAKKYEKKVKNIFNVLFRQAVAHETFVPDAAAILMYGPDFAQKAGDMANKDPRVRRAIDMLTEGSDNVYLAFGLASAPLILQLWRNHEEALNPKGAVEAIKKSRARAKEREPRRVKIPFTRRYVEFRFKLQLPSVRNFTNDPRALSVHVFSNPDIIAAMHKAGIEVFGGVNGDSSRQPSSG